MPNETVRTDGFYWVKSEGEWLVAEYSGRYGDWGLPYYDHLFKDEDFSEIGDRIEPPA
jgi:hypothetical protein